MSCQNDEIGGIKMSRCFLRYVMCLSFILKFVSQNGLYHGIGYEVGYIASVLCNCTVCKTIACAAYN